MALKAHVKSTDQRPGGFSGTGGGPGAGGGAAVGGSQPGMKKNVVLKIIYYHYIFFRLVSCRVSVSWKFGARLDSPVVTFA